MSSAGTDLALRLKSVLMATDLSPASVKPLHHALTIARHYGAKLHVTHVVSSVPYLMAGPEALELGCDAAFQDMQQLQRELLHDGSLNGLDYEFTVRRGCVWDQLRAAISEKQIDVAVVGTHGRCGLEKVILGSIAEEVFRQADCPVLTVGPHSYREGRIALFTDETRTYVFATDFSDASLDSLPHAVSFAGRTKARLIVVHVVPTDPIPQFPGRYGTSDVILLREGVRKACMRQLDQVVPRDQEMPAEIEFAVRFGIPSEKILEIALNREADLIILGLRRPSLVGTVSHTPWTTAYEVVCGAGCPVLTVRQ